MPKPKEIVKPELQTLMLAEEVIIKQRRPGCAECKNFQRLIQFMNEYLDFETIFST